VTDGLRLFGGFNVMRSRFNKFGGPGAAFQSPIIYPRPAVCPANLQGTRDPGQLQPGPRIGGFATCLGDVSGNDTPLAPDFTASLGATYTVKLGVSGELRTSLLYSYNNGYAFEADNVLRQGDFHIVNASVEYRPTESLGLELWVRNLGNAEYLTNALSNANGASAGLGAPRTYGANLKFSF
jgi:iron complex outermembrane receptor protein